MNHDLNLLINMFYAPMHNMKACVKEFQFVSI